MTRESRASGMIEAIGVEEDDGDERGDYRGDYATMADYDSGGTRW